MVNFQALTVVKICATNKEVLMGGNGLYGSSIDENGHRLMGL